MCVVCVWMEAGEGGQGLKLFCALLSHRTPSPSLSPPKSQPLDPVLDFLLAPFPIDFQYGVRRRLADAARALDDLLQSLGGGGPPRLTGGR